MDEHDFWTRDVANWKFENKLQINISNTSLRERIKQIWRLIIKGEAEFELGGGA